jgi:hypothetical protein
MKRTTPEINFVNNISDCESLLAAPDDGVEKKTLLVFDDILLSIVGQKDVNEYVTKFFIQRSHHCNCIVILALQNLFAKNLRYVWPKLFFQLLAPHEQKFISLLL